MTTITKTKYGYEIVNDRTGERRNAFTLYGAELHAKAIAD